MLEYHKPLEIVCQRSFNTQTFSVNISVLGMNVASLTGDLHAGVRARVLRVVAACAGTQTGNSLGILHSRSTLNRVAARPQLLRLRLRKSP